MIKKLFSIPMILGVILTLGLTPIGNAQELLFDNGSVFNEVDPQPVSILQDETLGLGTFGFGIKNSSGNFIADDFDLEFPSTLSSVDFYTYQTEAENVTVTGVFVQIYDGEPGAGGNVIWGDFSTNILLTAESTEGYRVPESWTGDNSRLIQKVTANLQNLFLEAGTYWIAVNMAGTNSSGPWAPPITITGLATTGDAIHFSSSTGYAPAEDGSTGDVQGLPFQIYGEIGELEDCEGTPEAGTINGPDSICMETSFTLKAVGGTLGVGGLAGQWQSSPAGQNDWSDIQGANSKTYYVADGISTSMDYRFILSCTVSGESDTTVVHSITLNSIDECYCIPTFILGCADYDDYIDDFILEGENGTSIQDLATGCSADSYDNRTHLSVDLYTDMTYSGTISGGVDGDKAAFWIDFNNNGRFEQDEMVGEIEGIRSVGSTYTIEIPADVSAGQYRMRIMLQFGTMPYNPCIGAEWGEAHDYTVNILQKPDCTGTPDAGTLTVTPSEGNPGITYMVSSSDYSYTAGLTYQWQSNTNGAGWVNEGEATEHYTDFTAVAPYSIGTTIQWKLIVNCTLSGESAESDIASFTVIDPVCDFITPSNELEDGFGFMTDWERANDFIVPIGKNTIAQQVKVNMILWEGADSVNAADIRFYTDTGGEGPGEMVSEQLAIVPTSIEYVGTNYTVDYFTVTFDINPVTLVGSPDEDTLYWMSIFLDATPMSTFWEVTQNMNTPNDMYSNYGEEGWGSSFDDHGYYADGIMEILGDCETLGIDEFDTFDFTYYPNPVKDVLNINSKAGIQSGTVYNMAGQKVMDLGQTQLANKQIEVSSLAPGVHIFRIVLENGQVETFKIIKK